MYLCAYHSWLHESKAVCRPTSLHQKWSFCNGTCQQVTSTCYHLLNSLEKKLLENTICDQTSMKDLPLTMHGCVGNDKEKQRHRILDLTFIREMRWAWMTDRHHVHTFGWPMLCKDRNKPIKKLTADQAWMEGACIKVSQAGHVDLYMCK